MPERVGLWRKSGKRGLLITSYKGLVKHTDRVKTSAAEAGIVPAHLWLPQSPQVKKLWQVHAQCSLGRSCYRPKKSCVYGYIVTSVQFSSIQFSHSLVSDSSRPHESQHARPPCPSPTPTVRPDPCPSSQ